MKDPGEREWAETVTGSADRIDRWLHRRLAAYSMPRVRELILAGRVRVNGRRVSKGDRVQAGDRVTVSGMPAGPAPLADPGAKLVVVHEDEDLAVVDKPPGLATHPLSPEETGTLINAALARWPEMRGVGEHVLEPGLLHRLDVKTRGLTMLARNQKAFDFMKHEFEMHRVQKVYRALVQGEVRKKQGEIKMPLARHAKDAGLMVIAQEGGRFRGEPREALTRYRLLEKGRGVTLLELDLVTGLMHQLRVHLAWLGHPVLGDDRYGKSPAPDSPATSAYALQAYKLGFTHPNGDCLEARAVKPLTLDDLGEWLKPGKKKQG